MDACRSDQGFGWCTVQFERTISEANGTHEVMNFCASWYPTVVASATVDDRSSSLASDNESSSTVRKPSPIDCSRPAAGAAAAAAAPFFARRRLHFVGALTAEEEERDEEER